MFVISLWLAIFSCMTSFFFLYEHFLEAPSQYSYLRHAIDLGTIVKLEMYPTLTSKNIETLILILINIQYLQIVFLALNEKGLNGQNHSSSSFHQSLKQSPLPNKSSHSSPLLTVTLFEKPCTLFEGWNNLRWN